MGRTRSYMLPVLIVVIGLEPIMFTTALLVARLPPLKSVKDGNAAERGAASFQTGAWDTAFVIPCHNSDMDAVERLLKAAYPHFRPQDIFIVDNANSRYPESSAFRDFLRAQDPKINYIWSPIGSKGAAQMIGAFAAKNYTYILSVDDDVCLPPTYESPIHLLDDHTKAVCFPIKAVDAQLNTPLLMVAWQDCEFRMSGLTKVAEDRLCGVCFPHGAGWFCERDTMIEIFTEHHSLDFFAEDCRVGFALMDMKKRLRFDASTLLETECPTTIIGGPGLNWFKQRMKSWEMGRHGLLLRLIKHIFQLNSQRTVVGFITEKVLMLYAICSIIIDWVRLPVYITMGADGIYWEEALIITFTGVVPLLLYKYLMCRRRRT